MEDYREFVKRRIRECADLDDWIDSSLLEIVFLDASGVSVGTEDLKVLLNDIIKAVQCANSEDM